LLDDSKSTAPSLEPPFPSAAEAEPPNQDPRPAPTEEFIEAPSPNSSPTDDHTEKPMTHGSDTEISGSESTPELSKQDGNILKPSAPSTPWREPHSITATPAQADSTGAASTDTKTEDISQPQLTPSLPNASPSLKAEPAASSVEAARPPGDNASGWHRLRKHLMVQPEAPNFPEPQLEKLGQEEGSKEKESSQATASQDHRQFKSKATKMWDAILYQMTVSKEKKQQQQAEEKSQKEANFFLPCRLPILLHKPRFDARKLKELAAKPMTKITTVFEASRFRPEAAEKHTKSFNRIASGWSVN
ncbi:Uncharacterized protein C11orf89, partial [Buceros rhinoceros silvestris]